MDLKERELLAPGQQKERTGEGTSTDRDDDVISDDDLRIGRIAYRRGVGENVDDEGPISEEDQARIARYRPARDFEHVRRWQDQHMAPELIAKFEEARRRWHERNDQRQAG